MGGLIGSAGSFGAMAFALFAGWLIEHHGYPPVFLIVGVLHPLAFAVILITAKNIGPLNAGLDFTPEG